MTPAELSDLAALRYSVEQGFAEMRSLVEDRRKEDNAAHVAIYTKMDANRLELAGMVQNVSDEQAIVRQALDGGRAIRRWLYAGAGLLAAFLAVIVAAAPLYFR